MIKNISMLQEQLKKLQDTVDLQATEIELLHGLIEQMENRLAQVERKDFEEDLIDCIEGPEVTE